MLRRATIAASTPTRCWRDAKSPFDEQKALWAWSESAGPCARIDFTEKSFRFGLCANKPPRPNPPRLSLSQSRVPGRRGLLFLSNGGERFFRPRIEFLPPVRAPGPPCVLENTALLSGISGPVRGRGSPSTFATWGVFFQLCSCHDVRHCAEQFLRPGLLQGPCGIIRAGAGRCATGKCQAQPRVACEGPETLRLWRAETRPSELSAAQQSCLAQPSCVSQRPPSVLFSVSCSVLPQTAARTSTA